MAEKIADIYAELDARTKAFDQKIGTSQGKVSGLTAALWKVGGALSAVLGVRALSRFGKEAIDASADAEEAESKFQVLFGTAAKETKEWASTIENSFGGTQTQVKSWLSDFQDILVPMGATREEAAKLSKRLTTLSGDLGSFRNAQTEDIIVNMTSALVGQSRAALSLGVVMNATAVETRALANSGKTAKSDLTNLEKVMARIEIITESSADANGDWERTMDSLANRQKILTAAWGDFTIQLGESIRQLFDVKAIVTKTGEEIGTLSEKLEGMNVGGKFIEISENIKAIAQIIKAVAVPALILMGAIMAKNALKAIATAVALGGVGRAAVAAATLAASGMIAINLKTSGKLDKILKERDDNIKRRKDDLAKRLADQADEDAAAVEKTEEKKQKAIKNTISVMDAASFAEQSQQAAFANDGKEKPNVAAAIEASRGTPAAEAIAPSTESVADKMDKLIDVNQSDEQIKKSNDLLTRLLDATIANKPLPAMG